MPRAEKSVFLWLGHRVMVEPAVRQKRLATTQRVIRGQGQKGNTNRKGKSAPKNDESISGKIGVPFFL